MSLRFDAPVSHNGYAWWYVDALSDDRRHGLTLIAFIGSVFSPYYARERRRTSSGADPANHCALNVALYGEFRRWAMTERSSDAIHRSATSLRIGPSSLEWRDGVLEVTIEEVTMPLPRRLLGVVRVTPSTVVSTSYSLHPNLRHRWTPIAPSARVEVRFERPEMSWSGTGYFDTNDGDAALEDDFERWHWSRAHHPHGTTVLYDATCRDAESTLHGLHFDEAGTAASINVPPLAQLPSTGWRIARSTRCDFGRDTEVIETLEDTPFYARSLVSTVIDNQVMTAIHESLSLDRFRSRWVQAMLPFRMPRAGYPLKRT